MSKIKQAIESIVEDAENRGQAHIVDSILSLMKEVDNQTAVAHLEKELLTSHDKVYQDFVNSPDLRELLEGMFYAIAREEDHKTLNVGE